MYIVHLDVVKKKKPLQPFMKVVVHFSKRESASWFFGHTLDLLRVFRKKWDITGQIENEEGTVFEHTVNPPYYATEE
jgi:hypothetical protein